ncbi:MAG: response regulator [Betaproteobacteria bacterium]|nr:response regulator [Betaproteobacteria bacterium]
MIDDDEAVFGYLQTKIGCLYDLVTTTEAGLAVDLAVRVEPDLILCDIDMPDINGGELSVKFRECEYTRHIPFAYLTSFVSPREVRDLRGNVGGRHGIAKATPAPEMIEMIEQLLQ